MEPSPDVERVLEDIDAGDRGAAERLFPVVYDELHTLAERALRRERRGHTLQATALVHEVYLKIAGQDRARWGGRTHLLAVASEAMRRILVDHARSRGRQKRGGDGEAARGRVTLTGLDAPRADSDVDAVALADALERLDALDPDQARVVRLRFFGGLGVGEIADVTGRARRSVERDWTHARAWLARELG